MNKFTKDLLEAIREASGGDTRAHYILRVILPVIQAEREKDLERLEGAEGIIRSLLTLRSEDGGRSFPPKTLLDEADQWLRSREVSK